MSLLSGNITSRIAATYALSAFIGAANAAFVQPDTATASSEFNADFAAVHTINGSGLPVGYDETSAHANYANGNHWTTRGSNPAVNEFIEWGFSSDQTLYGMYVWNHRSNVISVNPNYDVTLFDLTLFDALNNVLLHLDDVSLTPDSDLAQTFAFTGPINNVRRVLFDVEQTQGSSFYTGLAEVGFETEAFATITAPATLPLFALSMAGLIGWRKLTAIA